MKLILFIRKGQLILYNYIITKEKKNNENYFQFYENLNQKLELGILILKLRDQFETIDCQKT